MANTVTGLDTSAPGRGAPSSFVTAVSFWHYGRNRCITVDMQMQPWLRRDRLAALAAIAAPLIMAAVLVPFRTSFANTDAALLFVAVVVAVAANGNRLARRSRARSAGTTRTSTPAGVLGP